MVLVSLMRFLGCNEAKYGSVIVEMTAIAKRFPANRVGVRKAFTLVKEESRRRRGASL